MRILLAEDDKALRETIARGLRESSYVVDEVGDCPSALQRARTTAYDVVVLDVLMPGGSGLEVCRALRLREPSPPILMLTALDTVGDRIAGLDAGADDYLGKPFDFGELEARLRALTRRSGAGDVGPSLQTGDLVVDPARRSARRGHREIALTVKEYEILELLVRNAGRVVSRSEISEQVWGEKASPFSNLIDVYAARLRRKIDDGEREPLLATQRGVGYRVERLAPVAPDDSPKGRRSRPRGDGRASPPPGKR